MRYADHDAVRELAQQLARRTLYEMRKKRIPIRADQVRLLLRELRHQIHLAAKELHVEDCKAWAIQNGLLSEQEAAEKLGLSLNAFHVAVQLGFIKGIELPDSAYTNQITCPHYDPVAINLTEVQYQQIHENTLLTKTQAMRQLGLSFLEFSRLRRKLGIKPVKMTFRKVGRKTESVSYLYRQSDLEIMAEYLKISNDADAVESVL